MKTYVFHLGLLSAYSQCIGIAVRFTIYMQLLPLLQAFTPLRITTYVCQGTWGQKLSSKDLQNAQPVNSDVL